jgi:hypothetical protein
MSHHAQLLLYFVKEFLLKNILIYLKLGDTGKATRGISFSSFFNSHPLPSQMGWVTSVSCASFTTF